MRFISVPQIIQVMSHSYEEDTIIQYENLLSYSFVMPILLIGATMNFLARIYLYHENPVFTTINSLFMILMATLFTLTLLKVKNNTRVSDLFTLFFCIIFIFIVLTFYPLIGPAVWSISLILIANALLHVKRTMLIAVAVTLVTTAFYLLVENIPYTLGTYYYVVQSISLLVMFIFTSAAHQIIRNRFHIILSQYRELHTSEEKINLTLSAVGDGVITVDAAGKVDFMNEIAEDLTGWASSQAIGLPFDQVYHIIDSTNMQKLDNPILDIFEGTPPSSTPTNKVLIDKKNHKKILEDTISSINDREGHTIGAVVVFRDNTLLNQERKQIEYLSYHDQLTGLYNRRFYEEALPRLDTDYNLPISFIYGDVNGLKTMNDAFGHQNGDHLIKRVADVLTLECRSDDLIARIGGDEFVVMLPRTKKEDAAGLVDRIQSTLKEETILDIEVSVSFGLESKNFPHESMELMLKHAEEHMYQKKIYSKTNKQNGVIRCISNALHIKNPRENAHARRVSLLCEAMGQALGMHDDEIQELKIAGELHDIGKIAIDQALLNKPSQLTAAEWADMKKHPEIGYRLLATSADYINLASYVHSHHEYWDGSGYPLGLKGEAIPYKTRIITLADAYDCMTSDRPYRQAMTQEEAIEQINQNAGIQFDPELAPFFVENVLTQAAFITGRQAVSLHA